MGYSPWGCKELDMTELLTHTHMHTHTHTQREREYRHRRGRAWYKMIAQASKEERSVKYKVVKASGTPMQKSDYPSSEKVLKYSLL